MKKVLNITLGLLITLAAVAGAQAQTSPTQPTAVDRIIAQEDFKGVRSSAQPTAVDRIIAQEQGRHGDRALFGSSGVESDLLAPSGPTAVDRIIAQEQGRHADRAVFGPGVAPVQIVQRTTGGFDWFDAGIGGVAALALALLAAAGVALRHNRLRHGAPA